MTWEISVKPCTKQGLIREYAKAVGVIEMEKGYAVEYEVGRKSVKAVLRDYAPYLIGILVFGIQIC